MSAALFAVAQDRLILQCGDCGHFSMTEQDVWTCRHCAGSMLGYVEAQVVERERPKRRNIWRRWKASAR